MLMHRAMMRLAAKQAPKAPVAIFGATGVYGTVLAYKLAAQGQPLHLVDKDAMGLKLLASQVGATISVADVAKEDFMTQVVADAPQISGLAYCAGDADLKLLKSGNCMVNPADLANSLKLQKLDIAGAVQAATAYQQALAEQGGAAVLFSSNEASPAAAADDVIAKLHPSRMVGDHGRGDTERATAYLYDAEKSGNTKPAAATA